ncbi:MAG: hypothetical protein JRM74_05285 [Nitrososphaerota archaeon]|nr:hypothetical protein [Nitrososphaerota archaeon]
MKIPQRHAVSPIIATLLLIAIAVASGIVVYVFTAGLAGSLTKSGGSQVTEQISMDAYNYQTPPSLTVYIRNTGVSLFNITGFYFDGTLVTNAAGLTSITAGTGCTVHDNGGVTKPVAVSCTADGTATVVFSEIATSGGSHAVKFVTADGAQATFNVVAGQTG